MFFGAESRIKAVPTVADIGPGIQPMRFFAPEKHWCIEPCGEYADWLQNKGFPVIREKAVAGLSSLSRVDSVFMLDVIEHMEREEGLAAIEMALKKAKRQVVVFTPLGFVPQEPGDDGLDAWGMHGGEWQRHRSGWMPEDFPGWDVLVNKEFHGERGGAFFAIHG